MPWHASLFRRPHAPSPSVAPHLRGHVLGPSAWPDEIVSPSDVYIPFTCCKISWPGSVSINSIPLKEKGISMYFCAIQNKDPDGLEGHRDDAFRFLCGQHMPESDNRPFPVVFSVREGPFKRIGPIAGPGGLLGVEVAFLCQEAHEVVPVVAGWHWQPSSSRRKAWRLYLSRLYLIQRSGTYWRFKTAKQFVEYAYVASSCLALFSLFSYRFFRSRIC